MALIEYSRAANEADLRGIIALQRENLPVSLSEEAFRSEGFVTVVHDLETLEMLNAIEPHIIAKLNGTVIAYFLCMTSLSRDTVPVLIPMFDEFEKTVFDDRLIADSRYVVVGQVCVHKDYRRQGVFDAGYDFYKKQLKERYQFAVTEIDLLNERSIKAHKRIGFREIKTYQSESGTNWSIVVWPWY